MTNDQVRDLFDHLDKRIEARFAYLLREIRRIEAGEPLDPSAPVPLDLSLAESWDRSRMPCTFEITKHGAAGGELDRLITDLSTALFRPDHVYDGTLAGEIVVVMQRMTYRVRSPISPRGRARRRWRVVPLSGGPEFFETRREVVEFVGRIGPDPWRG